MNFVMQTTYSADVLPVSPTAGLSSRLPILVTCEWAMLSLVPLAGLAAALKVEPSNRMPASELQTLTDAAAQKRAAAKEKEKERERRRLQKCAFLRSVLAV